MIPCRETTRESLLSVGFATLNATAKFGCIPAGYVILHRSRAAFRRLYSYAIPSDSQAVVGASGSSPECPSNALKACCPQGIIHA